MKKYIIFILITIISIQLKAQTENPKREFRGAWMSTVFQEQYSKQNTEQNKAYIRDQLDKMEAAGINVVLFQARPSADAFYASKYEPWSKFISSEQTAPDPYWDPLEFIINEAHQRGMELHAWLNPYRVTTSKNQRLPKNHIYHKEPERFVKYEGDGRIYFDPGCPRNRAFIIDVITDIIDRYNVDGIHFDDYFYPYPANGKDFSDNKSYNLYGKGQNKADWRRKNVDKLIEEIHYTIRTSKKPWIRFGISPFGIWRNKGTDPRGSNSNGLQNYDDLYADVLLWADKGWIDYLIPQLYWELENKRAPSLTLIDWWADNVNPQCQLYIGQDISRTMKTPDIAPSKEANQLSHKIRLSRDNEKVLGNCWWPCYSLTSDFMGIATNLSDGAQSTYALVPAYTNISDKRPEAVKHLKIKDDKLTWTAGKIKGKVTDPVKYVVYHFDSEKDINLDNSDAIVIITPDKEAYVDEPGIYIVTAIDRVNNESTPSESIRLQ